MGQLDILVRKLASQCELDPADMQAIVDLPHVARSIEPGSYILREGVLPDRCGIMITGFAYRHKTVRDGSRQIVGLQIPGDALDFQNLFMNAADHNVQALTRCEMAFLSRADLHRLFAERPGVARAIYVNATIEASIHREWLLNIGRRDAPERLCHLLCEIATRLHIIGLADDYTFTLPMTQEQLGDALGLTSVHINRTLKLLERWNLIVRDKRFVVIKDWTRLRETCGFSALYLHLDRQGGEQRR